MPKGEVKNMEFKEVYNSGKLYRRTEKIFGYKYGKAKQQGDDLIFVCEDNTTMPLYLHDILANDWELKPEKIYPRTLIELTNSITEEKTIAHLCNRKFYCNTDITATFIEQLPEHQMINSDDLVDALARTDKGKSFEDYVSRLFKHLNFKSKYNKE